MPLTPHDLALLQRAAHGPQRLGAIIAVIGTALALARWRWLPDMPRVVPAAVILLALGLIGVGMVRQARWHWRRRS